jgi:hypothetical protein
LFGGSPREARARYRAFVAAAQPVSDTDTDV